MKLLRSVQVCLKLIAGQLSALFSTKNILRFTSIWSHSAWSVHVLQVDVCDLSMASGFLPHPQNMDFKLIVYSNGH